MDKLLVNHHSVSKISQMTIRFQCAECGKSLNSKDDRAGRSAKCPACGARVVVPHDGPRFGVPGGVHKEPPRLEHPEIPQQPQESFDLSTLPEGAPAPPRSTTGGQIRFQTIAVAAVVLIVAVSFVAWAVTSGQSAKVSRVEELPVPKVAKSPDKPPSRDEGVRVAREFIKPYIAPSPTATFRIVEEVIESRENESVIVVSAKAISDLGDKKFSVLLAFGDEHKQWDVAAAELEGQRVYVNPKYSHAIQSKTKAESPENKLTESFTLDPRNADDKRAIDWCRSVLVSFVAATKAGELREFLNTERLSATSSGDLLVTGRVTMLGNDGESAHPYIVMFNYDKNRNPDKKVTAVLVAGKILFAEPEALSFINSFAE